LIEEEATMRAWLAEAIFCAITSAPAFAQDQPPQRIRATIESVEGATLTLKTGAGETRVVRMKDGARVNALVAAHAEDIHPGDFVGAAAEPGPDGRLQAIEVHIFPEAARGSGEGSRPFDLSPTSTMTNGAVSTRVVGVAGPTLTVTYKGGQQQIDVTPKTVVVRIVPGGAGDLKPGASVVIFGARPAADGVLEAAAITVGRGISPPM
jgi:Domain of unknown function (DUF5666)